jgi:hypothetical protein
MADTLDLMRAREAAREAICSGCEKLISDSQTYGSIGGNIVPYIPAKLYHLQCIPTIKPAAETNDKCYAVVFMNYYPLEVDSLWKTRDGANTRIRELTNPGNWDICEMEIQ